MTHSKPAPPPRAATAPPMGLDQVLGLPDRKAGARPPATLADQLRLGAPPQMETFDGRCYPRGCAVIPVPALTAAEAGRGAGHTEPHVPEHADVEYAARPEPHALRRPRFSEHAEFAEALAGAAPAGAAGARTVPGADQRRVFYSTAYPWRCIGRVESALGAGSGVMVGPRHLLTCAHLVDWRPDGSAGWVKFTPMYYGGSAPCGSAWGTRVYVKQRGAGPTVEADADRHDYVVVVLDRAIGQATGWMGTRAYHDHWDGLAVWTHAGYPDDLTGGQRPTWQSGIALDGGAREPDMAQRMAHRADVRPGQRGGPFWGYWDGAPYAVATQSGQTAQRNHASGGANLVDLVIRARNEHP